MRYTYFFFLFLPFFVQAQGGWERTYNVPDSRLNSIVQTPNGQFIVTGKRANINGGTADSVAFTMRIYAESDPLWAEGFTLGIDAEGHRIIQDNDLNIIVAGTYRSANSTINSFLRKLTPMGEELWTITYDDATEWHIDNLILGNDGTYYIAGYKGNWADNQANTYIANIDTNGTLLWEENYDWNNNARIMDLTQAPDNELFLTGYYDAIDEEEDDIIIMRMSDTGTVNWATLDALGNSKRGYLIELYTDAENTFQDQVIYIVGQDLQDSQGTPVWRMMMNSYDYNGDIIISGGVGSALEENKPMDMTHITEGGFMICGYEYDGEYTDFLNKFESPIFGGLGQFPHWFEAGNWKANGIVTTPLGYAYCGEHDGQAFIATTDKDCHIYVTHVEGSVLHDLNDNCTSDTGENGLEGMLVMATKPNHVPRYAYTDAQGNYLLKLDNAPGNFTIQVLPPMEYWVPCDPIELSLFSTNETLTVEPLMLQSQVECPYLDVDIATNAYVVCDTTTLAVEYCNTGTAVAENTFIEVTLPAEVSYLSSTIPFDNQTGNVFTFNLGNVAIMECGAFLIDIITVCDEDQLGNVVCAEAHIFPDEYCLTNEEVYEGPILEVIGNCDGDAVSFTIKNTGTGNLINGEYIIIEDQIMYLNVPIDLPSGEEIDVEISNPIPGHSYYCAVGQEAFPAGGVASSGIDFCGATPNELPPYLLAYTSNTLGTVIDSHCDEILAAYDPNDKRGFPLGYGDEHLIAPGQSLDYIIRFQNTGNYPAENVIVVDTIPDELDVSTLRLGASSHPYTFEIRPAQEGKSKLVFAFNNINLPDSTSNEAASQGFITYEIEQKPDLEIGTTIDNRAAIYFDFNKQVLTETSRHKIGENFIQVDVEHVAIAGVDLTVFPNPFSQQVTFTLEGLENNTTRNIRLFDVMGRTILQQSFSNNQLIINDLKLNSGVYFFQIEQEGILVASGKLLAK